MKRHHKIWEQSIPISPEKAWAYFTRPENLNAITPRDFKIRLVSDIADRAIQEGIEVKYMLSPIYGLPLQWTTLVTDMEKYNYFIYEQKRGPYAEWRHEYNFREVENGVIMTDKLTYALKWGKLGELINKWVIAQRIDKIFDFRKEQIRELFGEMK